MNWRNFAAMNGQQAPTGRPTVSGRQSVRLAPSQTASISRNFMVGQISAARIAELTSVRIALGTLPNRRCRSQPGTPAGHPRRLQRRDQLVADEGCVRIHGFSAPLSRMRALYQFISDAREQRDREIDRHGDGDDLDRLAGLVERGAGKDRDQVGIADGDRERGVLGQVEILVGQRRDDHAQRLRQDHEAQRLAAAQARAPAPPRVCPRGTARMPARTISAMKAAV